MPPGGPNPGVGPPPGHHGPAPQPHVNPAFFPSPVSSQQAPPVGGAPLNSGPGYNPGGGGDPFGGGRGGGGPYPMPPDAYARPPDREPPQVTEAEFEEILQRNKTVSSSAISRAVQDASAGM